MAPVSGGENPRFHLKHVEFGSSLLQTVAKNKLKFPIGLRRGHITYRCKISSNLLLRNQNYRMLNLRPCDDHVASC